MVFNKTTEEEAQSKAPQKEGRNMEGDEVKRKLTPCDASEETATFYIPAARVRKEGLETSTVSEGKVPPEEASRDHADSVDRTAKDGPMTQGDVVVERTVSSMLPCLSAPRKPKGSSDLKLKYSSQRSLLCDEEDILQDDGENSHGSSFDIAIVSSPTKKQCVTDNSLVEYALGTTMSPDMERLLFCDNFRCPPVRDNSGLFFDEVRSGTPPLISTQGCNLQPRACLPSLPAHDELFSSRRKVGFTASGASSASGPVKTNPSFDLSTKAQKDNSRAIQSRCNSLPLPPMRMLRNAEPCSFAQVNILPATSKESARQPPVTPVNGIMSTTPAPSRSSSLPLPTSVYPGETYRFVTPRGPSLETPTSSDTARPYAAKKLSTTNRTLQQEMLRCTESLTARFDSDELIADTNATMAGPSKPRTQLPSLWNTPSKSHMQSKPLPIRRTDSAVKLARVGPFVSDIKTTPSPPCAENRLSWTASYDPFSALIMRGDMGGGESVMPMRLSSSPPSTFYGTKTRSDLLEEEEEEEEQHYFSSPLQSAVIDSAAMMLLSSDIPHPPILQMCRSASLCDDDLALLLSLGDDVPSPPGFVRRQSSSQIIAN